MSAGQMTRGVERGDALWSPLAHMPSVLGNRITIVSGSGAFVMTAEGQCLLDATAGLWHANIGHGRVEIAEAAYRQMVKLETYHSFGFYTNDVASKLADRVAGLSPIVDSKVIFTSGGSDSIDVALKLARRHWQLEGKSEKTFILSRHDSYHGLHAFGASVTGVDFYRDGYGPGTLVPDTARFSSTDISDLKRCIDEIGGDRIAAIVAEPVIGSGGIIVAPPGYFSEMQRLAIENDILVIADEVVTGFGRTGDWFASPRFGLEPDMIAVAKGITSGYAPLGALLIAPRVWERFYAGADSPVYHFGTTYSGHATTCAIAGANLDIIEREGLLQRSRELEILLDRSLDRLRGREDIRLIRTGGGFLAGIAPIDRVPAELVARYAFDHGVILRVLRENMLQVSPPFVIGDADVVRIVETIENALDHLAQWTKE